MSNIKIMVACHKPSKLPDNDLFLPVHVGSANSKITMDNCTRDDSGDNISDKNPLYCELTAQYWGWKNLDCDYIGLCHYRRYLYLGDKEFKKDLRNQIQAQVIDDESIAKFGLDDKAQMESLINDNDVIVGLREDVSSLPTPYGPKPTAYKHWIAHDRALIRQSDLDLLLDIVKDKYPHIYNVGIKALNDKYFVGYNCYIMKKNIFDNMNEYEFNVLSELEAKISLDTVHTQIRRIYGFMAEILFDMYVFYLESLNKYKIKHVPLVYFNNTDDYTKIKQIEGKQIIIDCDHSFGYLAFPCVQSILNHINTDNKYHITVCHQGFKPYYVTQLKSLSNDNVTIDCVDMNASLIASLKDNVEFKVPYQILYPFYFQQFDKVLFLSSTTLVVDNIDDIFNTEFNKSITAPLDVLYQGKINDIYPTYQKFLQEKCGIENVFDYHNSKVMLCDYDKIRHDYNKKDILEKIESINEEKLSYWDCYNTIFANDFATLDLVYGYQPLTNDYRVYQIPYAPWQLYQQYNAIKNKAKIIDFDSDDPFFPIGNDFDSLYWQIGLQTPVYHTIQAHMMARRAEPPVKWTWLKKYAEKHFPKNSEQRAMMTKIFPKKSKRRKLIGRFINEDD